MATMLQKLVTLSMSENELKLMLIALDSFHHQLKNKSTRSQALIRIFHSEKSFNIDFDTRSLITDLPNFLHSVIGAHVDTLYEAYYEHADTHGTLKELPPSDCPYSLQELMPFLESEA